MPHLALNNNCLLTPTNIDNFIEMPPPPPPPKQTNKQTNTKYKTKYYHNDVLYWCDDRML